MLHSSLKQQVFFGFNTGSNFTKKNHERKEQVNNIILKIYLLLLFFSKDGLCCLAYTAEYTRIQPSRVKHRSYLRKKYFQY